MAQHKRLRSSRYRKHLTTYPNLHSYVTATPERRRIHRAALKGRSSNAWLIGLGMGV